MSNYINNVKFQSLISSYCSGDKTVESELMEQFDILIGSIIDAFRFHKIEKDDAKQECFLLVLKTLGKFKEKNGSAFNYFTTVIVNNLKHITTKEKRHKQKIESYCEVKFGIYPQLDVSS